ncbi:MAG: hypothetical protein K2H73_01705 [Treponemataceae bacterium]|nr:hypothetical protein [Treponemataceae bacterium]
MRKLMTIVMAAVCCAALSAAEFEKDTKAYVAEKTAKLKSSAGLFARTVATVTYGDVATIIESGAKQTQVQIGKVTGWIENSALTAKEIAKENDMSVRESAEELARAAKEAAAAVGAVLKDDFQKLGEESGKAAGEVRDATVDMAGRLKEAAKGFADAFSESE